MHASVLSIPALRDLKASLLKFQHEAQTSLELMRLEMQRVIAWIEQDRPAYWQAQVRRAFDQVAATRTALSTCQMRKVAGRTPSCIEEKQAHEHAKRRLQHCHDQVKRVQQWATRLNRESDELRARLAASQRLAEGGIPRMVALLERSLAALEAYAEMTAPIQDTSTEESPSTWPSLPGS
jgi:hypothetical protein